MGDVVMNGEKLKLVGVEKEEERIKELKGLMKWEKFLPKMVLRVLLVEADDSTRQIISALLRKCSYKDFKITFLPPQTGVFTAGIFTEPSQQ
ncbi:hypothetical protein Lal_00037732 [Lupinus albus]|nr:hypothetical protein Lal_00037732 [Lupinus albus]